MKTYSQQRRSLPRQWPDVWQAAKAARSILPLLLLTFLLLTFLLVSPGRAIEPMGDEFQVNLSTTGDQQLSDVTAINNGGFVVVWQSSYSPSSPAATSSILAQRFDAQGQTIGGEVQVNVFTTYPQRDPRVDSRDDGSFIVQWRGVTLGNKGLLGTLQARSFDPLATPLGDDFQIVLPPNIYTTITGHDVAATQPGEFVVVSADFYTLFNGSYTSTLTSRRFAQDGTALGANNVLDTDTDQLEAAIQAGPAIPGDFVVAWRGTTYNAQYHLANSQRLSSDGSPLGMPVPTHDVNGFVSGTSTDAAFNDGGDWVVAWDGYDSYQLNDTGGRADIFSLRIDATGNADPSGRRTVGLPAKGSRFNPRLARGASDIFLLTWAQQDPTFGSEIRARLLDRHGTPFGAEIQVNSYQTGDQFSPRVAASQNGDQFFVVWTTDTSNTEDGRGLRAQRYRVTSLFVEGFESANLAHWSVSVP